jgi:hypothetical protein
MSHVDEGTLHALMDGELTAEEAAVVRGHLAGCTVCQTMFDEAQAFLAEADTLVESLDDEHQAPQPASGRVTRAALPWWRRPDRLAVAATVVLAAGAGVIGIALRDPATPRVLNEPIASEDVRGRAASRPAPGDADSLALVGGNRADLTDDTKEQTVVGARDRDAAAPAAAPALEERAAEPESPDRVLQAPADETTPTEREERAPRPQLAGAAGNESDAAKRANDVGADGAGASGDRFADAVQTLGGSIKLIDGRTVLRVEREAAPRLEGASVQGDLVRVVYQDEADREFVLEELRVVLDGLARQRAQADDAPDEPRAAQQRETSLEFLRVAANDTVISQETDSTVRIRWIDQDGFLLSLVGHDEAFLREMMTQIR